MKNFYLLLSALLFSGCTRTEKPAAPITADQIKGHIAVLANDSLTGRKPFTPGETKTINYISQQFKTLGLEPGNHGSYFQDVPMVEITGTPSPAIEIAGRKSQVVLNCLTDYVASCR